MKNRLFSLRFWICIALAFAVFLIPESIFPQQVAPSVGSQVVDEPFDVISHPTLMTQAVSLVLLSLTPFIIMILTSFIKIVIVLALLRNAIGTQQSPPNPVINGVAFMLSLFIMFPTGVKMYEASRDAIEHEVPADLFSKDSAAYFMAIATRAKEPMKEFLKRNSQTKHHKLFYRLALRMLPQEFRDRITIDDLLIIVPSYITSQLKSAFEIAVLIYIPFFVIDLVTANILLAMGMMMLSPVTISMPLKLFLLVMLDAWTLLIQGLVLTFQ